MKIKSKIIAMISAGIMVALAVTPITASAGCYAEDGTYFNYVGMGSYGVDDPGSYGGFIGYTIGGNKNIMSGGLPLGSYQCWFDNEVIGHDRSKVVVFGSHHGRYYDGTVNCWGGWVGKTATKLAGWQTTKGLSSGWINDDDSHTTWCGYCYWN